MKKLNINVLALKNFLLNNKDLLLFLVLTFLLYFLFFRNIFSHQFNFWNSDAMIKMFPVRVFLSESFSNLEYPFWTEKVFLGYPLYLDIENGALNPINLFSILLLGPVWSLKFLHLLTYLLGSLSIYFLVSRFYPKSNLLGKLVSVLGFYFTFFHVNHLIHMNIVLVSMLLPVHVYLAFRYFETSEFKFLLLQIILFSYGILWGQPQVSFFHMVTIFSFLFFLYNDFKKVFKYAFVISFVSFCLTFYQLFPSFSVFFGSQRIGSTLKYSEFTNTPTILFNNIFPYSLGYYQNFVGTQITGAYSFVESYNYLGISFLILFIFYLIYGHQDKNYRFVTFTTYFYLIFTFLNLYLPFDVPIYGSFRYWTRGIFIIPFLFLFSINFFLTLKNLRLQPKYNHLFYILAILIFTYFFESKEYLNFLIENKFVYIRKFEFVFWFGIFLASLISFFLFLKEKISTKVFVVIFLIISFVDLRYFVSDFLPVRISRYRSEQNFKTQPDCLNKRCLLENQKYNGYEFLLFQTYSPFGYSQFIDKEYTDFFDNNFFVNIEQSPRSEVVRPNLNTDLLANLGFQKILLADGNSYSFPVNDFWIMKDKNLGRFIESSEGRYEFEVNVKESKLYDLNLKYSKNFDVEINGIKEVLIKNGVFSQLNLHQGLNVIKISYFPYDIVKGFLIGISLLIIFYIVVILLKLKILNK